MNNNNNKKRIILIGRSAAGKTTFCQRFNREDIVYHKTQTIQIEHGSIIDTPGEYLERARMRGALAVASADADLVVLVQDATEDGTMFPPAYASTFAKLSIGLVTKIDIASAKQIEEAKDFLVMAGAKKIFELSSITGVGFSELMQYLDTIDEFNLHNV